MQHLKLYRAQPAYVNMTKSERLFMLTSYNNISEQEELKQLKKYFGYDSFRHGQREVIGKILSRNDVLAVMPTGSGKSICYQLPALMLEGITIVVSPLISLMRDQVAALGASGIRAAYINSTLTAKQCSLALANASRGMYKIIYVAPERLLTPQFSEFAKRADISLVAIDESHCVSEWGHDFRRSYLYIKDFVYSLKNRPIVAAFTATATEQVKKDIVDLLELDSPCVFTLGYDRKELYFGVMTPDDKEAYIVDFIKRRADKSGIIYCLTRKHVDLVHTMLLEHEISAAKYHAGLSETERNIAQDNFIYDRCKVIVATNAFGMGIDKSNVSYVLHFDVPLSIESYYQEAGRAGRDGMDAECVLLFSWKDVRIAKFLIEHSDTDEEIPENERSRIKEINLKKLDKMINLCKSPKCLRVNILGYFGEKYNKNYCGKCSVCMKKNTAVTLDSARMIVGAVIMHTGARYGVGTICDILAGKTSGKLIGRGLDKLYEYGAMKLTDKDAVKRLIDDMISEGRLYKSEGEYPVLKLTDKFIREFGAYKAPLRTNFKPTAVKADEQLITELKEWRKTTAYKLGVPPYIIITDMTLNIIALDRPVDTRSLLKVKGISEEKAEKYGKDIVRIVKKHTQQPKGEK